MSDRVLELTKRPLLLGHRGARAIKSIPENTLASFDRAFSDGCDGFEFDVRLTADGRAVVCHDPKAGGFDISVTPFSQLGSLPQLQDVLAAYGNKAFLDVELKVPGLQKIVSTWLRQFPPRCGFVVSSLVSEVLTTLRSEDATIPLGLICETAAQLRVGSQLPVEYVIAHHKLVTPDLIATLKTERKKIFVWTVNRPADMCRLADWEVDGIISDRTELLVQTLAR